MLQLHHFPGNASMAPHLVLEELGVAYELLFVDRDRAAHKAPAYLALNPNGLIPVLVDDAVGPPGAPLVLYETAAICLHLADTHAEAGLSPPMGSAERAELYKWLFWLSNTLQAWLVVYFYPERWAVDAAAVAQVRAQAEATVGSKLGLLDAQLAASGGAWLLGARFGVADPLAFMLCRWTRGFAEPARAWPHIGPYLERMLARPAVQRVLAQEGLAAPWV